MEQVFVRHIFIKDVHSSQGSQFSGFYLSLVRFAVSISGYILTSYSTTISPLLNISHGQNVRVKGTKVGKLQYPAITLSSFHAMANCSSGRDTNKLL